LGDWERTQRSAKKRKKLSKDRIEKLDAINFVWDHPIEYEWNNNYEALIKFLDENDGAYPSSVSENLDKKTLGAWTSTQRAAKKRKKLSKDRIEKLDAINFVWNPSEYEWNNNYEALIKFLDENDGAYPSKESENLNQKKLGAWANTQRSAKKGKKLSKDRLEKLNSIGFRW